MAKRKSRKQVHSELLRKAHSDGTYEKLLKEQRGLCALCGKPNDSDRRFDIDHNHATLRIRGLLHRGCNMRLRRGMTSDWLYKAADYLRKNGE
jgi:hypothetical protein